MDSTAELLDIDRRYLVHPLHHPDEHKAPLFVTEGKGAMLHLADGREVIDGLAGLWNVNVGHGRGELADAAAAQMRKIAFASAYVGATNEPAIRLSEKIVKHAYSNSAAIYFTTAGAESNESSFKFARYYWKVMDKPNKTKIISRIHAYHGVTIAAMSATGMKAYHNMFAPLVPGFLQVAPPYAYRWQGNEEPGLGAAEAVEKAILAEGPDTVAAVICEPVMGAGGVIVHPALVSCARGVPSAYLPLGGVIVSKRVHDALLAAPMDRRFMHAATYSGHPVCCAVGLRNVEIIENEGLVERAAIMGKRLMTSLNEHLSDLPVVGEIRGLGMMAGIELVTDRATKAPALGLAPKIGRAAIARGLLVRPRAGTVDTAV